MAPTYFLSPSNTIFHEDLWVVGRTDPTSIVCRLWVFSRSFIQRGEQKHGKMNRDKSQAARPDNGVSMTRALGVVTYNRQVINSKHARRSPDPFLFFYSSRQVRKGDLGDRGSRSGQEILSIVLHRLQTPFHSLSGLLASRNGGGRFCARQKDPHKDTEDARKIFKKLRNARELF